MECYWKIGCFIGRFDGGKFYEEGSFLCCVLICGDVK